MSILGLAGTVLRQVPPEFLGRLGTDYAVHGSIIRSLSTGRIVGHLQETSALSSLISSASMNPLGNTIGLVGQAVSIAQNEQIKSALTLVQSLQVANLALCVANIGVSVAGTAILSRQIKAVEAKIDRLLPHLEALEKSVEALRRDRIAEDLTKLRTIVDQLDECWLLASHAEAEWRAVAREAHGLANVFERRSLEMLGDPSLDPLSAEPFIDALALSSSVRVTARMGAGDDEAARHAATAQAEALGKVGSKVQFDRVVLFRARATQAEAGTVEWNTSLSCVADEVRPAVSLLRARELSSASTASTLEELHKQEISGREWLEAARAEIEAPLLFLPVAPGRESVLR